MTDDGRCEVCGQYFTLTRDDAGNHICNQEIDVVLLSDLAIEKICAYGRGLEPEDWKEYMQLVLDGVAERLENP